VQLADEINETRPVAARNVTGQQQGR